MNKPKDLKAILARRDKKLYQRYESIEEICISDIYPHINLTNYTDHGLTHSQNIQDIIFKILPDNEINKISNFENFCILTSSLLHDIGMIKTKIPDEESNLIRYDHANRTKEIIIDEMRTFGLSIHEAGIIGEICKAHCSSSIEYLGQELFSLKDHGQINVQFIAALLRMGDILDVCYDRAPDIVYRNKVFPYISKKHWKVHQAITNVEINNHPSWDIVIYAIAKNNSIERDLYGLRNFIQEELEKNIQIIRKRGLYYKTIDINIRKEYKHTFKKKYRNPFLLLKSFSSNDSVRFAGRNEEISQMLEMVTSKNIVILMGESGVGKTSLVQAGLIPKFRSYKFKTIEFSLEKDPISELFAKLSITKRKEDFTKNELIDPTILLDGIQAYIAKKKIKRLIILGDHLEQLFTIKKENHALTNFINQICSVLASQINVTFLFCIREDYISELFKLSKHIPEVYERDNTYKLYRLEKRNGIKVFERASELSKEQLPLQFIEKIVSDLMYECDGVIYPPYLQIVGYKIYDLLEGKYDNDEANLQYLNSVYDKLNGVNHIISDYLSTILDRYKGDEKNAVGLILSSMVTEFHTKKRVSLEYLMKILPTIENIKKILDSLVNQRIIKKSLGDYELIHDFLASRIIKLIENHEYLSTTVKIAVQFIKNNYRNPQLTSTMIASAAETNSIYLASNFQKQLSKSINEYLNSIRISNAKNLLSSSTDSIKSVSEAVGYKSQNSFSRKFKSITGKTPGQYRKEMMFLPTQRPLI